MDSSVFLERLKSHWLVILLGLSGFAFLLYGLTTLVTPKDKHGEITFEAARTEADSGSAQDQVVLTITIDVEGAVEKPGVYKLPSDARVQDALIAAGGMSETADREKISKGLNLAAKLTDGGKVYIPTVGEEGLVSADQTVLGTNSSASNTININTASASELDKLPGVGQVTAEKIISGRPYGSIEELVSKKVVSQKVYNGIKDKISLY